MNPGNLGTPAENDAKCDAQCSGGREVLANYESKDFIGSEEVGGQRRWGVPGDGQDLDAWPPRDGIRCESFNERFPDFVIPKNEIYSYNLVVGLIRL